MLWLVPLVAALIPLVIAPGTLAYFDITPKIAILLCGTALMLLHSGANVYNLRSVGKRPRGRWLAGLLAGRVDGLRIVNRAFLQPFAVAGRRPLETIWIAV